MMSAFFFAWSWFYDGVPCLLSSFAIILKRKGELVGILIVLFPLCASLFLSVTVFLPLATIG